MNREQLFERVSYMEHYHAVPEELYDILHYKKKRPKNYSVGTDSRFASRYLEYASPKDQGHDVFLSYVAFSIAASLSITCMQQPSQAELKTMLDIMEYTPEQMEKYVRQNNGIEPEDVPVPRLQAAVFILAHALDDAMADKSEWRRRKRYEENPALKRLQELTAYMEEKGLLEFSDWIYEMGGKQEGKEKPNRYDDFVQKRADSLLKRQVITVEMDEALRLVRARMKEVDSTRDRELRRIMKNPGKKTVAPFANPVSEPTKQELADLLKAVTSGELNKGDVDRLIERRKASMPAEARVVLNKADEEFDELTSFFDRILEKLDEMRDALDLEDKSQMQMVFLPYVAEDAFRDIVSGEDEIFKLKIGRYIWQDFMTQSTISIPVLQFEDLEDEDEWDDIAAEDNGRLALKVYDEDDLMEVRTDSSNGMEGVTVPLAAAMAKYAGRAVWPNLFIRKSYVKLFKDAGYSDRKARDFAVVLATLGTVDRYESANFELPYEKLYDFDVDKKGAAEESVGEKVEEEKKEEPQQEQRESAADLKIKELENDLKQARKANQTCRHEIGVLEREVERLNRLLEEKEKKQTETVESDTEEATPEVQFRFPYHTKKKVVVYGGFEVFHRELLKLMPDIRIVEAASKVDVKPIRNADIVFLQINKTDHSNYYAVCDACKGSGVPYIHLNYASARRCAEVMVGEIKKIEK